MPEYKEPGEIRESHRNHNPAFKAHLAIEALSDWSDFGGPNSWADQAPPMWLQVNHLPKLELAVGKVRNELFNVQVARSKRR